MKKKVVFILIAMLASAGVKAQSTFDVSGTVVEKATGEAVVAATIQLMTLPDSTFVEGTMTGEQGQFGFMRVNRQFIVSATAVSKLSTYFLGKMRIHVAAFPTVEIIVSKDKVATVKRWLDS